MNRLVVASAALLCAGGGSSFAQDFGKGFSVDGFISLNHVDSSGSGLTYVVGDVDLAYTFNAFGVAVSALGIADDSNSEYALFGGVTYDFGNGGTLTVGAPRTAYDSHAKSSLSQVVSLYHTQFIAGDIGFLTNSELNGDGEDDYGIRYDSAEGEALSYSGSLHSVNAVDVTIASLSGSYTVSGFVVSAGYEKLSAPVGEFTFAKLSLSKAFGAFTANAFTASYKVGGPEVSYSEISGTYQVNDKILLGALYGKISAAPDGWYGLSAAYEFMPGASARLGMIAVPGNDPTVDLSLKYTF
jgi:hypothetical protein